MYNEQVFPQSGPIIVLAVINYKVSVEVCVLDRRLHSLGYSLAKLYHTILDVTVTRFLNHRYNDSYTKQVVLYSSVLV